ncbi:transposase family protein [Streptomyces flaveolus]|uniref:helix-turn-helix domain-containing protein n=1 Tax=Streptomyces flaveolus TaxID=67297 RepID=UPI00341569C7
MRYERRPRARRRQAGAGPKCELVFTDRLLAALVHLRTGLTHEALGVIYEVGSCTIGRAIGEIRPLLAERGAPASLVGGDPLRDRQRVRRRPASRAPAQPGSGGTWA